MSFIFFDGSDHYHLPEDAEAFYEKYGRPSEGDSYDEAELQAAIEAHILNLLYGPNPLGEGAQAYLQETEPYLLEPAPFQVDADTVELHLRMSGEVLERNRDVIDAISDEAIPELEGGDAFALMVGATFDRCDAVVEKLEGAVALLGDAEIAVLGHAIPDGLADKLDRMSAAIRTLQKRLGGSWYHQFVDGWESE